MSTGEFKRRLAAILSPDVEGYSRLMREDEEATIRTLKPYRAAVSAPTFGLRLISHICLCPEPNVNSDDQPCIACQILTYPFQWMTLISRRLTRRPA